MSTKLEFDPNNVDLNDWVSFVGPDNKRLTGEVVRVYNSGDLFHVEVDGVRYIVDASTDDIRFARR